MEQKLDSYDRRILFELDKNARTSTTQIGKKIRKSKQFVDYRIKKLEERKIIQGYTAVIDYAKLGYISIRIYLKLHNITPEQQKFMEEDLMKDSEVWWLVTLEGNWNIAYAMAVKHPLDFYSYWEKITKKYRKYILDKSVVIYTHIKQYPKSFIIDEKNTDSGTLIGATQKILPIDAKDKQLLKVIADQARLPLLEIANKLKTSPQVIRNHIKKLEKLGIIQGYRVLLDVLLLGYRYYKTYINLLNIDKLAELEAFCAHHPNLLNINKTIGGRDFEIELVAKSFEEFEQIMNEIRTKFAGMIDEYEYAIAKEEKKMIYFPFE